MSKWRRFDKALKVKQASPEAQKTSFLIGKSKSFIGALAVLIVGLGIAAYATNDLLHGHITVTGHPNKTIRTDATRADEGKNVLTKAATASPKAASDLIDKYGAAADSPAVAAAIRKAERHPDAKAASDAYKALENGIWKPGADPMQAIMHGYVPPGMEPQQAAMLYSALPHLPKSPRTGPMTAEMADRLAGGPPEPSSFNQEDVRAANQQMLESHMRQRFGPIHVPPLHREHNRVVSQNDNQMSLIQPEYSFDPGAGGPPRTYNPAAGSQSISEMTDQSGNVVSQYRYDPYGKQTKIGGTGPDADFGYQGYYVHQRSGLNLTATRAYNPTLGRFISRDPIEERGGVNLYSYVKNDPINYADPSGLRADSSRSVPCPTHCDNRNGYKICIPYWCLEETRTGRQPGNAGQKFVTVSFTLNGQRYEAQDDLINGGCYWQKAGQ